MDSLHLWHCQSIPGIRHLTNKHNYVTIVSAALLYLVFLLQTGVIVLAHQPYAIQREQTTPLDILYANNHHRSLESIESCRELHRNISFIPEEQMRLPPLLLSLPGSGNTWVRLLLEMASGYFTGAIYDDLSLLSVLQGEKVCGLRTIAIKAHPNDIEVRTDLKEFKLPNHAYRKKCSRGSVGGFKKVILLLREPYESILSDSQNSLSSEDGHGNHTGVLLPSYFASNNETWQVVAMRMAHRIKNNTLNKYIPLTNSFAAKDILEVRYENLLMKNASRIDELRRMVEFAGFTVSEERLHCAFISSDHGAIHRQSKLKLSDTFGRLKSFSCEVWEQVKIFSSKYGYPNLYSCG